MAPGQDTQLEKVIDEVLKSGDVHALDVFLQRDIYEVTLMKCSKQFLSKLDKLVCRCLDQKDSKSASLGLTVVYKCGEKLKLPGVGQGLSGVICQGLIQKMVQWFEKCRKLWIQCGPQWNEPLYNLSEDFFDALTVVHEACKEGTYKITESFLYALGQLGVDPRIYILIRKEAIRKFNLILDKIPTELKKERKILTSQEASDIMIKVAGQILEGGDYDLQTALMEALCRMATPDQRKEMADRWFSMEHVASAFAKIRDAEFETDCRKFLNLVNGMQGDRRRVYSYPCLEVYLDKNELLMPADEKLDEFWIDFNLGSHSISFYFSLADGEMQEGQWETICISENEVQSYTVTEEGKRKVLQLKLSEVVVVGGVEGSNLTIHFSSSLDILQAARSVYGHSKNKRYIRSKSERYNNGIEKNLAFCEKKGFVGKMGTSVVKTTVKIIMEENNSQVVPESQVSLGESEKNTVPYLLPASSAHIQMVTPARMRISESTTFISNSAGGSVHSASSLSAVKPSNTPANSKGKPCLEMVRLCDRKGEFCAGEQRMTAKTCSNGTAPRSTIAGGMIEKSDMSLQGLASKQANKNKLDKYKKNIPLAKAVDMVLAGQGEEQPLEDNFVPDTQPRPVKNMSFNWNKLSVSEMVTMPTQKINTVSRLESHSNSAQQQEHPTLALRLSVPGSGPINHKQLHTELTQRLQQVLIEKNQDHAPQEPAATQRKMSGTRGDSKGRGSADQCASTLGTSNKQQAQRNGLAKGNSKGRMSLKADVNLNKAPVKAPTTVALQEKIQPNVKAQTNRALSSKEKSDAKVAESMVKLISSHYEINNINQSWTPLHINKPLFNMSWLSTAKRDVPHTSVSLMKSHSKTASKSSGQRKDIFAFNTEASLSIGGKDKAFPNTSSISNSGIHESSGLHNATEKGQPMTKEKRYVKKHLFSDTDTDYAMTEVSWLRESSRKPKPKVTKYSRQAPIKPKAESPHTSYEIPDLPPPSPKHVKGNTKPNKKKHNVKERVVQPKKTVKPAAAPSRPHAAGGRPKRAVHTSTKSYREPDTDDSQSESATPVVPKPDYLKNTKKTHEAAQTMKKQPVSKQPTKRYMKPESNHHSRESQSVSVSEQPSTSKQQRPENVLQETSKLHKKNVIPVLEEMNALKDSWAARQTSFSPSPPFVEKMRSAERSAPILGLTCSPLLTPRGSPLPASPDSACQDTPSPILLLPKPHSTVSSKGNFKPSSSYSAEKKFSTSKTQSIQSALSLSSLRGQTPAPHPPIGLSAAEISPVQQHLSPAPRSPLSLSLPLLTSTLLDLDKQSMPSPPQSPFPEDTINHDHLYGFSKVSSVSQVSLSQSSTKSSVLSRRVKDCPSTALTVSHKTEKTPSSDRDVKPVQLHMSGPSRKRHITSTSESEEDEKEDRKESKMRGQRSPRMKPRKLFKSFAEVSAVGEVSQVMSSSHTVSSSHWEAEVRGGDMDMDEDLELPGSDLNPSDLCQQFSSDLKKKFQNRYKTMEFYNKQSLKTVQQHVSSLNMQVTKYRTQRLAQVQKALLQEIDKLEQDDTVLKRMEKDLTIHWKKQTVAFRSYQEQGTKRNETLKKALHSNVCHSLEYEQRIFTSKMCLIRKDMKSVQDRLLSEMQDGEIQSVKRGLHALFFP